MANTLTGLVPSMYEALDIVSREQVGFIPAVTRNTSAEKAALNQVITIPIAPQSAAADNVAAVTAPNTGDQVIGNVQMAITKSKHVPVRWNGEEQRGAMNAGWYGQVLINQFAQAFRTLCNLIEADLAATAYQNSSRAYGTAGTAPFGVAGDLSDVAQMRKILDDNGAPPGDLQLVLNSSAVANMRGKQTILLKVNEAGSSAMLRAGSISDMPLEGFQLHNSAQLSTVAPGAGTGYVTSGSTAPGVSAVALVTGSGAVNPGDIVTFAADTANKYVVNVGVSGPGTASIGAPGAQIVIPSGNAMTSGGTYRPSIAFSRSAIQLVARTPALPVDWNGKAMDMADDMTEVTDPRSGLVFQVALYRQFLQLVFHVRIAWGCQTIKSQHVATLLG